MMMYYLTPSQMRLVEKKAVEKGVPYFKLMENAGDSAAKYTMQMNADLSKGIVVLCGNGDNGGDGLVCTKSLAEAGHPVTVVLMCGEPNTENSMRAYINLANSSAEVLNLNDNIDKVFNKIASASVIIDGCFGIGFHGELPPQVKACLSYANRSPAKKIALDIPSGCSASDGSASEGAIKCDVTLTMGCPKIGMIYAPLKEMMGKLEVLDIGLPKECYQQLDYPIIMPEMNHIQSLLPERKPDSHKGTYGRLLNIAGSRHMPGAAALSTKAALRAGVGLCTLAAPKSVCESLSSALYECTYLPLKETPAGEISSTNLKDILFYCNDNNINVVSLGCGVGTSDEVKKLVAGLLEKLECTLVLDADGINCLGGSIDLLRNTKARVIITPHPGELARLLAVSLEQANKFRMDYAVKLSEELGITVVAKGSPITFVAGDNGFCYMNSTGNAGLARGGSGDVLTGMIASLTAQGLAPADAAPVAVYLHGMTADQVAEKMSMQGMLPSDVIDHLPYLFRELNR